MAQVPLRTLIRSNAQIVVVITLLLTVYLVVPIEPESAAVSAVTWAALLASVTVIIVSCTAHAGSPGANSRTWRGEALNRTGALSFAVTVLSTVGLGDINPKPDPSRLDLAETLIRHLGGDALRAECLVQNVPASDARTLMWARVTMHRQASGVRRALASVTTTGSRR